MFQISDLARAKRFLILGSEGQHYYVSEQALTLDNARCLERLVTSGQGEALVKEIVSISTEGRAAKQSPGLFALAVCARLGDLAARRAAFSALNDVCRTATALVSLWC